VDNWKNITNSQNRVRKKSFGGTFCFSSAAEEEIAKQFPTELWRVLKFSILHVVVIICFKIGGALFETRRLRNHFSSLLI
jgi:hypothetical protein